MSQKPVAWWFETAMGFDPQTNEYSDWRPVGLTWKEPNTSAPWIRNVIPLYKEQYINAELTEAARKVIETFDAKEYELIRDVNEGRVPSIAPTVAHLRAIHHLRTILGCMKG